MSRHLIHVGYPKAGSTFLQAWFERHPELGYAPGGLGGYSDAYAACRMPRPRYRYYVTSQEGLSLPYGRQAGLPRGRAWAADSEAGDLKEAQAGICAWLKDVFPDSRVLIVTRGFRGIMFSGYSQYVRTGGVEPPAEIAARISERLRIEALHLYDFDYLVGLYSEAFGEENVLVLPYELLRDDPARFLGILEDALGVAHLDAGPDRLNPSLSPEELYWYPVLSRWAAAAASRLGPNRGDRAFRRYSRLPFRNRLRSLIRILARLRPDLRIDDSEVFDEAVRLCVGRADRLRKLPAYAPYGREYLWDRPDEEGVAG